MATLLCPELLHMETSWILYQLRVKNSLNGALKKYFEVISRQKQTKF